MRRSDDLTDELDRTDDEAPAERSVTPGEQPWRPTLVPSSECGAQGDGRQPRRPSGGRARRHRVRRPARRHRRPDPRRALVRHRPRRSPAALRLTRPRRTSRRPGQTNRATPTTRMTYSVRRSARQLCFYPGDSGLPPARCSNSLLELFDESGVAIDERSNGRLQAVNEAKPLRSELKNTGYEIFIGILSILSIVNLVLLYAIRGRRPRHGAVGDERDPQRHLPGRLHLPAVHRRVEDRTTSSACSAGPTSSPACPFQQVKILRVFRLVRVFGSCAPTASRTSPAACSRTAPAARS